MSSSFVQESISIEQRIRRVFLMKFILTFGLKLLVKNRG